MPFICPICERPHTGYVCTYCVKENDMSEGKVFSELLLELCFICDEPTERAGKGEDSLYCDECDKGPYCPDCFRMHHESDEIAPQLRATIDFLLPFTPFADEDDALAHSKGKTK